MKDLTTDKGGTEVNEIAFNACGGKLTGNAGRRTRKLTVPFPLYRKIAALRSYAERKIAHQRSVRSFDSNLPVVAPLGTVATIKVGDSTLNCAAIPLNVTAVVPVRLSPRIATREVTLP